MRTGAGRAKHAGARAAAAAAAPAAIAIAAAAADISVRTTLLCLCFHTKPLFLLIPAADIMLLSVRTNCACVLHVYFYPLASSTPSVRAGSLVLDIL